MIPTFTFGPARYPMTVTVLSHNRLDELQNNMPDLIGHCSRLGYELIVADNASRPEVQSYLVNATAGQPGVKLVLNQKNHGVGGGRNTAFALVESELILSIDDDTRVSFKVLADLPGLMRGKCSDAGILALRVKHSANGCDQNYAGEHDTLVRNHHGAACVIRRDTLAHIGGMEEDCDFGLEELDMCIRAHAAGFKILYTPDVVVCHNSYLRPGRQGVARRRMWIFNNARTMYKYFPMVLATTQATRYFLWTTRGDILGLSLATFVRLLSAHVHGCCVGLRHRRLVPAETVDYFADQHMVPDNGNHPCLRVGATRWLREYIIRHAGPHARRAVDIPPTNIE